ncbi:hypothetical protein LZ32DRAFT_599175 [Colletotrichum eremochloae]|nr:hypothetical protein LZ32DRAFT_599175 [Colletotrichum eremochloae]
MSMPTANPWNILLPEGYSAVAIAEKHYLHLVPWAGDLGGLHDGTNFGHLNFGLVSIPTLGLNFYVPKVEF